MVSDNSFDFEPATIPSSSGDSEVSEELYQEFLRIKNLEELAGKPIPEMTDICRRMTPPQRLTTGMRMTSDALREIREAVLAEHPGWSQMEVCMEVGRRMEVMCA